MSAPRKAPIVVIALAVVAGSAWWFGFRAEGLAEGEWVASGVVEAVEADLGFQAGGRLAHVAVREGEVVKAGQLLATLESAELEARGRSAEAQRAAARAQLAELRSGSRTEEVAAARAAVAAAAQQRDEARRDADRLKPLYEAGAVAGQVLDRAETAAQVAVSRYDQALEALRLLEVGARPERIDAAAAAVAQADAAVAQTEAALSHATIVAPFDGVVTVRHREPGEAVSPGMPVLTVMDPRDLWVRIYVPEPRVAALMVGAPATIAVDGVTDKFEGRVVQIANEAEFTPRNVQTAEERVKLVFAVRVAVVGDERGLLKPGLPVDVRLDDVPLAGGAGELGGASKGPVAETGGRDEIL